MCTNFSVFAHSSAEHDREFVNGDVALLAKMVDPVAHAGRRVIVLLEMVDVGKEAEAVRCALVHGDVSDQRASRDHCARVRPCARRLPDLRVELRDATRWEVRKRHPHRWCWRSPCVLKEDWSVARAANIDVRREASARRNKVPTLRAGVAVTVPAPVPSVRQFSFARPLPAQNLDHAQGLSLLRPHVNPHSARESRPSSGFPS